MASTSGEQDNGGTYSYDLLSMLKTLPMDVGNIILGLLPSNLLLLLQSSNDNHIVNLACNSHLRTAYFREPCHLTNQTFTHFISVRAQYIQELVIDNQAFIKPKELCDQVMKCHQLKVLSVRYCGLNIAHLQFILSKCKNVVELSWSAVSCSVVVVEPLLKCGKPLEKLRIDVYDPFLLFCFMTTFKVQVKDLKSLELHFYDIIKLKRFFLPYEEGDEKFYSLPKVTSLTVTHPCMVLHNTQLHDEFSDVMGSLSCFKLCIKSMLQKMFADRKERKNAMWEKFWTPFTFCEARDMGLLPDNHESLFSTNTLFISGESLNKESVYQDMVSVLVGFPRDSLKTVGLSLKNSESHNFLEYGLEQIADRGGNSLSQFVVPCPLIEPEEVNVPNFNMFLCKCRNITSLNIAGIHLKPSANGDPCDAIGRLQGLRELHLPVCALDRWCGSDIQKCNKQLKTSGENTAFAEIVKKCKYVEYFRLVECGICELEKLAFSGYFNESHLGCMHQWSHLKHLRIECVTVLRQCPFLIEVGRCCASLKSLELANIGDNTVCHYVHNLLFMLKLSKSISFLRIVQNAFNYTNSLFWKSLANATNLQGLCIATAFEASMNVGTITGNLSKLRNCTTFHLYYPVKTCPNIEEHVRTVMARRVNRQKADVNIVVENIAQYLFPHRRLFARRPTKETNKLYRIVEPACPSELCAYKTNF